MTVTMIAAVARNRAIGFENKLIYWLPNDLKRMLLVEQTVDDNGTVHFTPKTIYLPAGKKAFILSLDDLSYYHSYDNHGIASKIVLDENGKPTCEYINQDGTVSYGAYDCIPLLDAFLEEHPDGAYRGARGTIAQGTEKLWESMLDCVEEALINGPKTGYIKYDRLYSIDNFGYGYDSEA